MQGGGAVPAWSAPYGLVSCGSAATGKTIVRTERSQPMGDKGGKKDKDKTQKQKAVKQEQQTQKKQQKQEKQKSTP
jgi:hypothetical protein